VYSYLEVVADKWRKRQETPEQKIRHYSFVALGILLGKPSNNFGIFTAL
jgi:hypothetical protein